VLLAGDGAPVEAALTGVETATTAADPVAAEGSGPADDAGETKPRRRRRRGGAHRRGGAGETGTDVSGDDAAPDAAAS